MLEFRDATELSAAIRGRSVSCVEVMNAHLDLIERINPHVNAVVSLRPRDELLAEAAEKDRRLDAGQYDGWMHGLPHAVKDLADVAGMKTSAGFFRPPFDVEPAAADSAFVARLRAAGAIFIGKTNTPEFGLGSHTYNNVFGTTRNAYDRTKCAGGSSGGAAVAVALRMLPVADGSDFMGSLRNPPGWNNVFGLRPSFGRIAGEPGEAFLPPAGVAGPVARTARDLGSVLRTMAGDAAGDDARLVAPEADRVRGRRVAWLGDLGGYLPMEPEVLRVTRTALDTFAALDMSVTDLPTLPSFGSFAGVEDLWPTWLTLRHWLVGGAAKPLYDIPQLRDAIKPELRYEIEGLLNGADGNGALTALDVFTATVRRADLHQAFVRLFAEYDYVVLPTAQVMPFDADLHWPDQISGIPMSSYHRWMEVTTIATLVGAPTLAAPAGFSSSGLPIGIQVLAREHAEQELLDLAAGWEGAAGWLSRRPPLLN
ncbi:MAG TPA: amidase [Jatrophihabitantaceae bacterium]